MGDFTGFRFGNVHSEDLHLVVVSSSDRYEKNLLPENTDYTADVPGSHGRYYFGQTHGTREFVVNVAYDNVSEEIFRKISQLFATDKLQDLVFDELPYKTYKAKLKNKPEFKHICFTNRDTGKRVYKGEGTLTFVCYFPYAFGLNKYIVRAADYYKCVPPELIYSNLLEENPYRKRPPKEKLPPYLRRHYNKYWNMNTPWEGGFPSVEQVQGGELYFVKPPAEVGEGENLVDPLTCSKSPTPDGKSLLIDVRGYWKNIPEWQDTAKLLTTPTLDYDQELIFMPQYSKINYMNMDTGLNKEQGVIGSRILVYNPGDLPVEFELKLNNLKNRFRANDGGYNFRVSRYNVQRLTIEQAVDWTGLTTLDQNENDTYSYGNRYFKVLEKTNTVTGENGATWNECGYRTLKKAHPRHCYIAEPIPQNRLAHYIQLFYWQSYMLNRLTKEDYYRGKAMAERYDELYDLCISDDERNQLYWETLDIAIIGGYELAFKKAGWSFNREAFKESFYQHPSEYIRVNSDSGWTSVHTRKYGEVSFNARTLPQFITEDYLEFNVDQLLNEPVTEPSERSSWNPEDQVVPHTIYIDSERRMCYNYNEPEWKNNLTWLQNNPTKVDNFYNFKESKTIHNEAIEQGKWFKIPPGWSLISIDPVVDEDRYGGKLWKDARPFTWGNPGTAEAEREKFDSIYFAALRNYLRFNCPKSIVEKFATERDMSTYVDDNGVEHTEIDWDLPSNDHLEDFAQFRRWYGENEDFYHVSDTKSTPIHRRNLAFALIHKRNEDAEYGFLRLLSSYWNLANSDGRGNVTSGIEDWWWKASSYIYANFPPLYWGYADLLNSIEISYTPLFY